MVTRLSRALRRAGGENGPRRADDGGSAPALPRYFTDGVNLYRFVRWIDHPARPRQAELEDCRSLHCMVLAGDDLVRMSLRPVSVATRV